MVGQGSECTLLLQLSLYLDFLSLLDVIIFITLFCLFQHTELGDGVESELRVSSEIEEKIETFLAWLKQHDINNTNPIILASKCITKFIQGDLFVSKSVFFRFKIYPML